MIFIVDKMEIQSGKIKLLIKIIISNQQFFVLNSLAFSYPFFVV